MTRVAYVCADPGVPVFGRKGCSIHVQEVIRAMRRRGATVELFARRLDGRPPSRLEDLVVHPLPRLAAGDPAARERAAMESDATVREALRCAGRFDLVYERHAIWSCGAMELASERGVPGLLEVNAPLVKEQATYRALVHRAEAERCADRAFAAARAIIAVSAGVAEYLDGLRSARGRVHVIPNGVDPARFVGIAADAARADRERFTVGFVGTLKPWHGLDLLIEAFDRLHRDVPGARLLIVGDGPERQSIEQAAARRGIGDAVTLAGAVDPADIPSYLAQMDVAVAPYPPLEDFYFSPLKVLEYMAGGIAIAASAIGQVAELIADGRTGLLCAPGDAKALAEALRRLHESPSLRQRLGATAREQAVRGHSWDAVVRQILELAAVPAIAARRRTG